MVEQARREELTTANHQLAQYAGNLEELTISRERNRMARELHDTLAHTLSGLSVQLETARAFWDVDEGTAKELLDQSLAATRSGLQETRRALQSLRATPLEDLGLVLALKGLAESAESRAGLTLDLDLPTQPLTLTPAIEQAVYRIAQEAVNNVIKHATAKTLMLSLQTGNPIELVVADDGVGFFGRFARFRTRRNTLQQRPLRSCRHSGTRCPCQRPSHHRQPAAARHDHSADDRSGVADGHYYL